MTKRELRQQLRETLASIAPADFARRSADVHHLLFELTEYRRAETIMIYLSTPQEVDTAPIAVQAWADTKRVLAPSVSWEQRRMLPVEIKSLTTDVRRGQMGIPEPVEGMPIPVSDIDLLIVPGLAFDPAGNRLGRGRGFYDRFLAHRDFRAIACGVALDEQYVQDVPQEENDVPLDMIVTDTQVRRFRRRGTS